MKKNPSLKIYIFHHNKANLPEEINELSDSKYQLINLDNITLPEYLIVPGFSETENKAFFAEYLGILYIKPETELVGCFTYSIPLKFSAKWAQETGNYKLFLPEIKFKDLNNLYFDPKKIYAPEFNNPCHLLKNELEDIHQKYPTGTSIKNGPFKGSFIVARGYFLQFQEWFKKVTQYIIKNYDLKKRAITESTFGMSAISCRDQKQKEIDKLRNAWGYILERAVAYYFGNCFKENDKIKLGLHIASNKVKNDSLLCAIKKILTDNTVIVIFGDKKYEKVIKTWCQYADRIDIKNYIIIAQDKLLYQSLSTEKINCALKEFEGNLKDFWTFRLKIIKNILDVNINVIHSDADAYWLKNPIRDYFLNPDYDILSSQGTIQPPDVLDKLGFVLCCGLMYFKCSPNTINFFEKLLVESAKLRSDQIAINRLIANSDVQWENIKPAYSLEYNNKTFNCYDKILTGKSSKLTVGILPHKKFQRLYENSSPYIAHLLSQKTQKSKLDVLSQINKYSLNKHSISITEKLNIPHKNISDKSSNLVWLASYPRSGNTLLRIILNNNFNLKSYSIYNDPNDIGKIPEVREVVGHVDMDWSFLEKHFSKLLPEDYAQIDELRYTKNEHTLVKTHSPWHNGFLPDKAIYIYRDGRSALRSHSSYNVNFTKSRFSEEEFLEQLIVCGAELPSTWNNHVLSWLNHPADKILVLKFEDVISDFQQTFKKISRFLNVPIKDKNPITFEQLHAINPHFFRRGKKKSWDDLFNKVRNSLFWFLNNEAMRTLGYDNEKSPICDLLPDSSKPATYPCIKKDISKKELIDRDALLTKCLNITKKNIAKVNIKHKEVVLKNFIDSYAHCIIALSLDNSKRICFKNYRIFNQIINLPKLQDYKNYWPYIYIATPTYNSSKYLDQAIHSVVSQEGNFFIRYHIQDGSSTDETVSILKKWKKRIDSRKFDCFCKGVIFTYHSCKDEGMYDALNKAFKSMDIPPQAIMSWINSDDMFLSGAFSLAFQSMTNLKKLNWLIGRKRTFGVHGELRGQNTYVYPTEIVAAGLCDAYHWPIIQQEGIFFRKKIWDKVSGLDDKMKYAGDWDLWKKFAQISSPVHTAHPLAMFRKRKGQLGSNKEAYSREVEENRFKITQNDQVLYDRKFDISTLILDHNSPDQSQYKIHKRKINATEIPSFVKKKNNIGEKNISIFTSIEPNRIGNQRKAIDSWLRHGFKAISINCKEERIILEKKFTEVNFITADNDARNEYGLPLIYINDLLKAACESNTEIVGFVNSDILIDGINIEKLISYAQNGLIYAHRTDINFPSNTTPALYDLGIDSFFIHKKFIKYLSGHDFSIGRTWWDFLLPIQALAHRINLYQIQPAPIFHEYHEKKSVQHNEFIKDTNKFLYFLEKTTGNLKNITHYNFLRNIFNDTVQNIKKINISRLSHSIPYILNVNSIKINVTQKLSNFDKKPSEFRNLPSFTNIYIDHKWNYIANNSSICSPTPGYFYIKNDYDCKCTMSFAIRSLHDNDSLELCVNDLKIIDIVCDRNNKWITKHITFDIISGINTVSIKSNYEPTFTQKGIRPINFIINDANFMFSKKNIYNTTEHANNNLKKADTTNLLVGTAKNQTTFPRALKLPGQTTTSNNHKAIKNLSCFYLIVFTYNFFYNIDKIIKSILSQSNSFNIHCHVQDNGSTDGTIEKIKAWETKLSTQDSFTHGSKIKLTWSCLSEQNQFNALDKTINMMNIKPDDYIGLICDGKVLMPESLKSIIKISYGHPEIQWLGIPADVNQNNVNITYAKQNLSLKKINRREIFEVNKYSGIQNDLMFFKKRLWFRSKHAFVDHQDIKNITLGNEFAKHVDYYQFVIFS